VPKGGTRTPLLPHTPSNVRVCQFPRHFGEVRGRSKARSRRRPSSDLRATPPGSARLALPSLAEEVVQTRDEDGEALIAESHQPNLGRVLPSVMLPTQSSVRRLITPRPEGEVQSRLGEDRCGGYLASSPRAPALSRSARLAPDRVDRLAPIDWDTAQTRVLSATELRAARRATLTSGGPITSIIGHTRCSRKPPAMRRNSRKTTMNSTSSSPARRWCPVVACRCADAMPIHRVDADGHEEADPPGENAARLEHARSHGAPLAICPPSGWAFRGASRIFGRTSWVGFLTHGGDSRRQQRDRHENDDDDPAGSASWLLLRNARHNPSRAHLRPRARATRMAWVDQLYGRARQVATNGSRER